ncbi:MAG: EAL domain-containing protein, partial [Egicoccus sp.]
MGTGSAATGMCCAQRDLLARARVVIVDDLHVNTVLLERMLTSAGVSEIHTVSDSRDAVARCREVEADLVLLDLHMPHLDGHAVLAGLRANSTAGEFLPVLVLTADTSTQTRDRALQAGATDFLAKPLDYSEVVLRVRNLLETRALHLELHQRNVALQAELDARAAAETRLAEQREARIERIDAALAPGVLHMMFQPIVDLHGSGTVGYEALARFACEPARTPDVWFDEAASIGRGTELELAAARAALEQLSDLPDPAFLTVNVSPTTVMSPALSLLLGRYDQHRIVLELTEHARVDDYPKLLATLEPLRAQGVRIAVDDTGAGYAGLQHLLHLRPKLVKLDLQLTRDVDTDPARRALATALVTFSRELGSTIVAEGIETSAELDTLRELVGGPEGSGQGNHYYPPSG